MRNGVRPKSWRADPNALPSGACVRASRVEGRSEAALTGVCRDDYAPVNPSCRVRSRSYLTTSPKSIACSLFRAYPVVTDRCVQGALSAHTPA